MGDCEHEQALRVNLERDRVRKPIDQGSANDYGTTFRAWPNRKGRRGILDPFDHARYRADELVTEAGAVLVVPEGR